MTRDEIRVLSERYSVLRGAFRAVSPAPEIVKAAALVEPRLAAIRGSIHAAGSSVRETPGGNSRGDAADREKIEGALGDLTAELIRSIRALPFWQFRATLPAVLAREPKDLVALLELTLADPENRWWDLIDYVATLLASEERGGRRRVVRDAAAMTRCLHGLCAQAAEEATEEDLEPVPLLEAARDELERGEPLGPIVERMRREKESLEHRYLIPTVLRAVVAYNISVSNRLTRRDEARRSLEEAELDILSMADSADGPGEAGTPRDDELPAYGSFELGAVEAALRDRILEVSPASRGPAAEVAAALDIGRLAAYELAAFRKPEDAGVESTVRMVVTIGLVAREGDRVSNALALLGLDPAHLHSSWTVEIDQITQKGIRTLIMGNHFDEAQCLAEVRTKFLNQNADENVALQQRRRSEPNGPFQPLDRRQPSAQSPRGEGVPERRGGERRRSPRPPARGSKSWLKPTLAVGLSLALAAGGAVVLSSSRDAAEGHFTKQRLLQISPYLTDAQSSGSAFIGTVDGAWERVPEAQRFTMALEIGKALQADGFSEVRFLDRNDTTQLHFAAGSLILPRASD